MNGRTGHFLPQLYRRLTILAHFPGGGGDYPGAGRANDAGARIERSRCSGDTVRGTPRRRRHFPGRRGGGQRGTSAAAGLRTIASLDALLALQSIEDPTERRKRAVKNGRQALDVLDALKLSVLDGTLDQSVVGRLKSACRGAQGRLGRFRARCRSGGDRASGRGRARQGDPELISASRFGSSPYKLVTIRLSPGCKSYCGFLPPVYKPALAGRTLAKKRKVGGSSKNAGKNQNLIGRPKKSRL